MRTEDAMRLLEEANESLRKTIQQLITAPHRTADCYAGLRQAARVVEDVRNHFSISPQSTSLVPVVRAVLASAARTQSLLDSAASFYCGLVSVKLPDPVPYTSEGQIHRSTSGGRLQLEA
jgi:hypothetical protein